MLATSFGLTRPLSGQYLQQKKLKMLVHITRQFLIFYKYWPDNDLVRPKIVANI
jgi:hypothetical protein